MGKCTFLSFYFIFHTQCMWLCSVYIIWTIDIFFLNKCPKVLELKVLLYFDIELRGLQQSYSTSIDTTFISNNKFHVIKFSGWKYEIPNFKTPYFCFTKKWMSPALRRWKMEFLEFGVKWRRPSTFIWLTFANNKLQKKEKSTKNAFSLISFISKRIKQPNSHFMTDLTEFASVLFFQNRIPISDANLKLKEIFFRNFMLAEKHRFFLLQEK